MKFMMHEPNPPITPHHTAEACYTAEARYTTETRTIAHDRYGH